MQIKISKKHRFWKDLENPPKANKKLKKMIREIAKKNPYLVNFYRNIM